MRTRGCMDEERADAGKDGEHVDRGRGPWARTRSTRTGVASPSRFFKSVCEVLNRQRAWGMPFSAGKHSAGKMQMFQYFVKVVPTDFVYLNGTVLKTNQFSYTENAMDTVARPTSLPGANKVQGREQGEGEGRGRRGGRGTERRCPLSAPLSTPLSSPSSWPWISPSFPPLLVGRDGRRVLQL